MARIGLILVLLLALAMAIAGIRWGLPSRRADRYLFGTRSPWSGERLVELKGADWQQRRGLGADVDVDPLTHRNRPIDLTETDRGRAEILIRYRLYSHQPDEATPLRALAGMRPARFQFDPKAYQYGGLFIYPVGMLIGLGSVCKVIDVRSDLAHYLDHPSDFGAMYVASRAYSAAFGLLGVIVCTFIGRRLGGEGMGVPAGLLFVLMPVIVTMSHEGKPHLPGAVMMLLAGLAAMRYVETGRTRQWVLTSVICGLAGAMVLSAWPVAATLIAAIWLRPRETRGRTAFRLAVGIGISVIVFLSANPYLVINLFADRDILWSNLGTSAGMYSFGRIGEGAWTIGRLLIEGMGPALAIVGAGSLIVLLRRRTWQIMPLIAPAGLVLVQFACIGAGKPGEYGRFLAFPAAVLAIVAAWGIVQVWHRRRVLGACLAGVVVLLTAWDGGRYLIGFVRDTGTSGSRLAAAAWLSDRLAAEPNAVIGLIREPAPYCAPPLDFDQRRVILLPERKSAEMKTWPHYIVCTFDRPGDQAAAWWASGYGRVATFPPNLDRWLHRPTVISWADKPVAIFARRVPSPPLASAEAVVN